MKTLKIFLIATVVATAAAPAFANGLTDKDAQVINLWTLQRYHGVSHPYIQNGGGIWTTER